MSPDFAPLRAAMNAQMRDYASALTYKLTQITQTANTGALLLPQNPQRHSIVWGPYNGSPWYIATVPLNGATQGSFFLGNTIPTTWSITVEGIMVTAAWYGYAFTNTGFLAIIEGLVIH
jgi:hypothetical protein